MSFLVLDRDTAQGQGLARQLTDLGLQTFATVKSDEAIHLCARGGVQGVLCADFESLADLQVLPAGIAIVYLDRTELEVEQVLAAVRAGAHDCWQLPMESADIQARCSSLTTRMQHRLAQANSELYDMRVELERDQRAGQYIQLGMLPPNPMGIGHFRLQHKVEPSLILSGDFVDYFQITDRHFACYVADVSGHGASSAFVTVLLKNFSRRLRREYRKSMLTEPGEVLAWINTELIDQQIDKHVAMFFAVVDTTEQRLYYANAAHFPPAILAGPEGLVCLEQKGKPLGIFADANFESRQVEFPPGARLAVFSDGVLDLISAATLKDKEQQLVTYVRDNEDMESLWSALDLTRLGQDDVSCLMVTYEQ